MSRLSHISPALVISILALVAALVVPALALTRSEKRVVRKVAKVQANKQITERAPGLEVAGAGNADRLDGRDASDFTAADEVHNSGRVVLDDLNPNFPATKTDLLVAGAFTIQGTCTDDAGGGGSDQAQVQVVAPTGTSFSGSGFGFGDGAVFTFASAASSGHAITSGHGILVAPNGQVLSVSESAEVGDPAGDCVFGVTAVGP